MLAAPRGKSGVVFSSIFVIPMVGARGEVGEMAGIRGGGDVGGGSGCGPVGLWFVGCSQTDGGTVTWQGVASHFGAPDCVSGNGNFNGCM